MWVPQESGCCEQCLCLHGDQCKDNCYFWRFNVCCWISSPQKQGCHQRTIITRSSVRLYCLMRWHTLIRSQSSALQLLSGLQWLFGPSADTQLRFLQDNFLTTLTMMEKQTRLLQTWVFWWSPDGAIWTNHKFLTPDLTVVSPLVHFSCPSEGFSPKSDWIYLTAFHDNEAGETLHEQVFLCYFFLFIIKCCERGLIWITLTCFETYHTHTIDITVLYIVNNKLCTVS